MGRLSNKVVTVTGATSGIGRAASLLFAKEGARVVVAARREAEGEKVVEEIKASGGEAVFARTDVSSEADCRALVERAVEAYGTLDLAFNNAGTNQQFATISDLPTEEWRRVVDINLTAVFLCMKYQIAQMLKGGGGAIVNTSSVGGLVAGPMLSAYQSAKHGVVGLTKVAAMETAKRNIRVNALCPGGTHSEMFDEWLEMPGVQDMLMAAHPMGRFAQPQEQAEAALFLLSDAASFITGVALPVDGGLVVP